MTEKQYGVIKGKLCICVGDTVAYWNNHSQHLSGVVLKMFVEEPGLVMVQRRDWPSPEAVNLNEYERVNVYTARMMEKL